MSSDPISLSRCFAALAAEGRSALIPYLTAGYRDPEESLEALLAVARAGADVIELGIPFSDPLADGPTIQRASFRALEAGMTVRGALELLRRFRASDATPVVLFTYLNPLIRYGTERFVADARDAGAQGLLLTDLPVGSDPELETRIAEGGLDLIRLIAPTTSRERVSRIAQGGRGFLYYISRTGVTGARSELRRELAREVSALSEVVDLPIAVGFGISTQEQAAMVGSLAEGVVVGSALIQALDEGGVEGAESFVRALRLGMDRGPEGEGKG